jgi:hypothetical protein
MCKHPSRVFAAVMTCFPVHALRSQFALVGSSVDVTVRVANAGGVGAVLRADLVEQVCGMELRGFGAGADLDNALLVCQPLSDETEHLPLAGSESLRLPQ